MVNIRRQRLKAIRAGCSVKACYGCKDSTQVLKLMRLNDKKNAEGIWGHVELKEEDVEDGPSE